VDLNRQLKRRLAEAEMQQEEYATLHNFAFFYLTFVPDGEPYFERMDSFPDNCSNCT